MTPTDTDSSNVVPPNELEHRRRVLQLSEDMSDLMRDFLDRAREMREIGVIAPEWLPLVFTPQDFGDKIAHLVHSYGHFVGGAIEGLIGSMQGKSTVETMLDMAPALLGMLRPVHAASPEVPPLDADGNYEYLDIAPTLRMRKVIDRLFAEAPKMTDAKGEPLPDQAPAIDVHILLRGAPIQFAGVLSKTAEGTLKLLTPVPAEKCMVEQFFDYADVASVAVQRNVAAAAAPRIITS